MLFMSKYFTLDKFLKDKLILIFFKSINKTLLKLKFFKILTKNLVLILSAQKSSITNKELSFILMLKQFFKDKIIFFLEIL